MKIDFHYYAVYTIARLCGIKDAYAEILAFASQHVDEARYDHTLYFAQGGRYKQIKSAHRFLSFSAADKDVMYDIYMPFHYIPNGKGEDFEQRMLCKPFSETLDDILKDTYSTLNKDYGLHRMGVVLHVIADSFSHNNFSA